jgi:hypothetical protein
VADVVVGTAFDQVRLHREHGRGALQRLDLRLLVTAQHSSVLRRVQVQPDNVEDLRLQLRIGREPERARPPRLDPIRPPRLGDRRVANLQPCSQQARRPVTHPQRLRWRLQRLSNDPSLVDRARPTRTLLVRQPRHALSRIPRTPGHHRLPGHPDPLSVLRIRHPVSSQQDDARPLRQPGPHRTRPRQPLQLLTVTLTQRQGRSSTIRHTTSCRTANRLAITDTEH